MYFKNAVEYRYKASLRAFEIFYGIIFALLILEVAVSFTDLNLSSGAWAYGATVIFLFVVGLNSFKPELKFMLQNGYSRQSVHASFLCYLPIGIINAVICVVPTFISYKAAYAFGTLAQYFNSSQKVSDAKAMLVAVIIFSLMNIMALSLGYFISALYYRFNSLGKVIFSVFASAAVIIVSTMATSGGSTGLSMLIINYFMAFFFGTGTGGMYYNHLFAAMIFVTAISMSAAHLLIRKAPVKK